MESHVSKAEFTKKVENFGRQNSSGGGGDKIKEISDALIESYSLGWYNEKKLNNVEKAHKKMINDLKNEIE